MHNARATDPPTVSVVIPTYERGALVREAVDSVLAQTFSAFELLVVDDGSTDGTAAALAGLDERLRCHRQEENRGVSAARNVGIRLARAGIVAFLDSDDVWLPDHLETVVAALADYPQAVLASTCPGFGRTRELSATVRLVDLRPASLILANVGFVPCVAVRREALLAVGGFDERLSAGEDNDLWTRLSLRGPFAFVQHRTVVCRPAPGGLRELGRSSGTYLSACALSAARVLAEVERMPGAEEQGLLAPARAAVQLSRALNALARRDEPTVRSELAEACRLVPRLVDDPSLFVWRTGHTATTDSGVCESCLLAARLWPEPGSETALALRRRALRLAVRSLSLGVAAGLAAEPALLAKAIWGYLPERRRRAATPAGRRSRRPWP